MFLPQSAILFPFPKKDEKERHIYLLAAEAPFNLFIPPILWGRKSVKIKITFLVKVLFREKNWSQRTSSLCECDSLSVIVLTCSCQLFCLSLISQSSNYI